MKHDFIRRAAAMVVAAAVSFAVLPMSVPELSALEFIDPAVIYAQRVTSTETSAPVSDGSAELYEDTEFTDSEDSSDGGDEITDELTETDYVTEAEVVTETTTAADTVKTPATEISLYNFKTSITVGDSFQLKARLKPTKSDDTITYKSSKSSVAKVSADGTVTGLKAGTTVITATTSSGVKDRISLIVKAAEVLTEEESGAAELPDSTDETAQATEKPASTASGSKKATEIELKHSSVTLVEGETYQIKYSLYPATATDTVTYRTLRKSVATVASDGTVTAKGEGNTRIVCTTSSGVSVKLSVTVIRFTTDEERAEIDEESAAIEYDENGVLKPSKVRLDDESMLLKIGENVKIGGKVYPKGCVFRISYSSSDTAVAKVSKSGKITGVGEGSCVITAVTDNGKSDEIYVTVYGNMLKGIDVSKWNGDIDWKQVKQSGEAGFVMIRASYGEEDKDIRLEQNVAGCEKYNIPYGFYHYTYAKSISAAKKEARFFINCIKDYSPQYPVVLDIEESFYDSMPEATVTAIVTTFMEELEGAGYYAMIYSYAKFFDDNLVLSKIDKYDVWVACWGDEDKLAENYCYHYGMWQYSETGTVSGIPEDVDLNYAYKDYAAVIRHYGLNNL